MTINPIPDALLGDSFTLLVPTQNGFSRTEVYNVRVERKSAVSDITATRMRDVTELVVYYDCVSSFPEGIEFQAGQQAEYDGEVFEVLEAKLFSGESPHHWKLVCRKTGSRS